MPDSIFTGKDNGKQVAISVGTRIKICLPENPTTGYQWSLRGFKNKSLALESDDYAPADSPGIGGGGIRQFLFVARLPGNCKICLDNRRAWEKKPASIESFVLLVTVAK